MIKYIGSKRVLVPHIVELVASLPGARSVLDLFAGTSRVGHALKARGLQVHANDHNAYAEVLARCYVQADGPELEADARKLLAHYRSLPGRAGYFTETFCERSRFFQPHNGERIDAIRDAIAADGLPPELEAVALTSLMEAADRVDSTTGVQMAYLKQWAPRSYNQLELRLPQLLPRAAPGKGSAHGRDAVEFAGEFAADVAYLDPPYNAHKYLGNYHVWETLVRWDRPEHYGVACKRADCRVRSSAFNSRPNAAAALRRLLSSLRTRWVVLSFNDEGFFTPQEITALLQPFGLCDVHTHDTKRYVGAQIGIFNPRGEKVGRVGRLRNVEFLFVLDRERIAGRAAAADPAIVEPTSP